MFTMFIYNVINMMVVLYIMIEIFEKSLRNEGYKLLSRDYKNAKAPLPIRCPNGHVTEMRWNDFQQGHRCKYCANNVKYEKSNVFKYFNEYGYIVVSNEYENTNKKLKVICQNKHEWEVSFKRFKNGVRCPYCNGNAKNTTENVRKILENEGYELLSEYINAITKLKMKCPKGHLIFMRYNNFQQGQRCSYCNGGVKFTNEYVKEYIQKEGYVLLTPYKNALSYITLKCPNGHEWKTKWNWFKSGQRCYCNNKINKSKAEEEIINYIKNFYNGTIINGDRTLIKNPYTNKMLELDIWMPEKKIAIEFNGVYWHSIRDVMNRDKIKREYCDNNEIRLLIIDEQKWITNKENCLNYIKNEMLRG